MASYAVIIRHLPNNRPVTCGVIQESNDPSVDDMDHYLYTMAEEQIKDFVKNFVEFRIANWYVDLIRDFEKTPYDSRLITVVQ